MPTTPAAGQPRSADVVNDDIRALFLRSGGRLCPLDRERYRALRAEWAEAVRREAGLAA
jgi:hypothetical protein